MDWVTFAEGILNSKLHILCSDNAESDFGMLTKNDFKKVEGSVNINFDVYKYKYFYQIHP